MNGILIKNTILSAKNVTRDAVMTMMPCAKLRGAPPP